MATMHHSLHRHRAFFGTQTTKQKGDYYAYMCVPLSSGAGRENFDVTRKKENLLLSREPNMIAAVSILAKRTRLRWQNDVGGGRFGKTTGSNNSK